MEPEIVLDENLALDDLVDEDEGEGEEENDEHLYFHTNEESISSSIENLEDGEEEEEEIEEEQPPNIEFFGKSKDEDYDSKQNRLIRALQKRDFKKEEAENPPPPLTQKYYDKSLSDERKMRLLAQFPSTVTVRRYDKPYTPIQLDLCTNYSPTLPQIGILRKVKRERPQKEEIKKAAKIIMPHEEPVENPFFYPQDIPSFMERHEEERLRKREENLKIPVKEKLHGTALIQQEVIRRVKPYQNCEGSIDYDPLYNTITWEAGRALNISRIQKVSRKLHANYAKHRKAVFYSEYGIYARHKALEQLHEQEEAEEIALKNYEFLSNYTAESLDAFLRESEDAKNQASKVAEDKLRENLLLTAQSRDLNQETSSMKAEISSLNDSLRECKYYMQFLDNVARELMRRDEEDKYRTERRQQQIKEDLAGFLKEGMTLKQAQKALKEKNKEFAGSHLRHKTRGSRTESAEFLQKLKEEVSKQSFKDPLASRINSILSMLSSAGAAGDGFDEKALLEELNLVEGDEITDREELAGLVFTRPAQLLDIYVDVEEQNLSLIQHAQINEETLEGLERRIRHNRKGTEGKSRRLRDIINSIEEQMQKTKEQIDSLNLLIDMFTGGYYDVKSQEKLMRLLRKHVNKVYKTCVGTNDAHLSSVLMLTSIEKNFEDVVRDLEAMPDQVVFKISRGLEKERRESERVEHESIRQKHRDERISRSLERARAPVKQKKGRNVSFRSRPPKQPVNLTQKELDKKAEEDEWNYYFGE